MNVNIVHCSCEIESVTRPEQDAERFQEEEEQGEVNWRRQQGDGII